MLGFHVQQGVPNWLDAVSITPAGTWHKVFSDQQAPEIKSRGDYKVVRRHHYDHGQHFGGNWDENIERARLFFSTFVNDTFRDHAWAIDAIEGWNEFIANGMTPEQYAAREIWVKASQHVWTTEYRDAIPEYAHIRLCSTNTAVGNDITRNMARSVYDYGGIMGYHAYVPQNQSMLWDGQGDAPPFPYTTREDGVIDGEHPWYSMRWQVMDSAWRQEGIYVDWLFTEAGEVRMGEWGGLDPVSGWKHPHCGNGQPEPLLSLCRYWLDHVATWNNTHGNRALGGVVFTTGGYGWESFEKKQPELNLIAEVARDYQPSPPNPDPDPDPPPPSGGLDPEVAAELWQAGIDYQTNHGIQLNPQAALQKAAHEMGYNIVTNETRYTTATDGKQYGYQIAERLTDGHRIQLVFATPWAGEYHVIA